MTAALYQHRTELVAQLERGRDNVLTAEIVDAGAPVTVTEAGSTVTVYDAGNVAIVDAAAITLVSGVPTYTLTAATTTDLPRGEGWRIEWSLVLPERTQGFRRDAALVTCRLAPPATLADVFRRVSSLDPSGAKPITGKTLAELDGYLDDAWISIEGRLVVAGRRPWLILSPQALREPLIVGTLALIFEDLATRLNAAHAETARAYRADYSRWWADARFAYDADDSGAADSGASGPVQVGASGTLWLSGTPSQVSRSRLFP